MCGKGVVSSLWGHWLVWTVTTSVSFLGKYRFLKFSRYLWNQIFQECLKRNTWIFPGPIPRLVHWKAEGVEKADISVSMNKPTCFNSAPKDLFFFKIFFFWFERKRKRNIGLLFHLFMHSLVDSCTCPGQGSNLQPWCTGLML